MASEQDRISAELATINHRLDAIERHLSDIIDSINASIEDDEDDPHVPIDLSGNTRYQRRN